MKKDDKLAHYNIRPEDQIHGLDNWLDPNENSTTGIADKEASKSTIVPNDSSVQLKSKETFAEGDEDEDNTAEHEAND